MKKQQKQQNLNAKRMHCLHDSLALRAELFEGRLALTWGKILIRILFSLVQKHFLG